MLQDEYNSLNRPGDILRLFDSMHPVYMKKMFVKVLYIMGGLKNERKQIIIC